MIKSVRDSGWQEAATEDVVSTDEEVVRENWRCRIANSRSQREAAFRLIYQAYVRSGLGLPNAYEMRVTPYHLLSTTTIFTAELLSGASDGDVFSTVSLVGDGRFGLPLERIYPHEVATRREQGLRLAEVSCLADRRSDFRRFFPVFCALNRWMIQAARAQGYDQILVAVHPRHARFYSRNMGFELIGELAEYPSVCNRPAVPLCFDFARNDENRASLPYYSHFFDDPIAPSELQPTSMSAEELALFSSMIDPLFQMEEAEKTL